VLAAGVALLGVGGVVATLVAVATGLALGAYAMRLVGGMTGDLYGATVEITEATLFITVAALANRGWIEALILG
jgi:adenosylcobinamide-GDP ribazoletransferase